MVAEADAEYWFFEFEGAADDVVEWFEHCGVAWAVGHEDSVEVIAGFEEVVVPWGSEYRDVASE